MRSLSLYLLGAWCLVGCSTEPSAEPDSYGTAVATVDAVKWDMMIVWDPDSYGPGTLYVWAQPGTKHDRHLFLTLNHIDTTVGLPVTVQLAAYGETGAGGGISLGSGLGTVPRYETGGGGCIGAVTVSEWTTLGARGTFWFTACAVAGTGASGTKTVTDGNFSLTFSRQ